MPTEPTKTTELTKTTEPTKSTELTISTETVPSAIATREVIMFLAIFCVNQLLIRRYLTVPIMRAREMYSDALN
jgi:hypothetical protein